MAQPPPPNGMPIQLQPGQQPTPEQIRQMQAQIAADAQRAGLTVPQYIERVKQQMMQQAQLRQQLQQQQQQQQAGGGPGEPPGGPPQQTLNPNSPQAARPGQQIPIAPGPPKPEALALAAFLRAQDLKPRQCIFQEKRKDMFRVKRAMRALQSDAYARARAKNPLLPAVTDRVSAENTFKLLPISLLALRVSKVDPHAGHGHAPPKSKKRVKGLWTVKVEPQQEASDEFYYVWLYEGSQWKNKLYAVGALVGILAVVFFPVWPYRMRLGVWYISMGMLGLLGLFFAMAIFRLILFLVTLATAPPGLWLFPNLFEDVGFFDSFKPVWGWHEDEKTIKKRKKEERDRKKARREAKENGTQAKGKAGGKAAPNTAQPTTPAAPASEPVQSATKPAEDTAVTTGSAAPTPSASLQSRNLAASVEEADD